MSMNSMRLQPNKEECFEFCIRSFELSERAFRNILNSATYTASFLKKQITSLPSNATLQYSRLYHAYTTELADVRNLKVVIATGNRVGWSPLIRTMRKLLTGLPLSGTNLGLLTAKLREIYPAPERKLKETEPAQLHQSIEQFNSNAQASLDQLQRGLESCTPQIDPADERPQELEVKDVLEQVRARKQRITQEFQQRAYQVSQSHDSDRVRDARMQTLRAQYEQEIHMCELEENALVNSMEAQQEALHWVDRHRTQHLTEIRPAVKGVESKLERTREAITAEVAQFKSTLNQIEQRAEERIQDNALKQSQEIAEYQQSLAEAEKRAAMDAQRVRELEAQVAQLQMKLSQPI